MKSFEESLLDRVVLFDGAMGTYLYQLGVFLDKCYDELNLTQPDLIRRVHREYLDAGAAVIETNTFGANRIKLERHHLADRTDEINREGAALARAAAGDRALVAGSMGPIGAPLSPLGPLSAAEVREAFTRQARALAGGGVDLFVLETFHDLREIEEAVRAVREASDLPVVALVTVQEDGRTRYGVEPEEIGQRLSALPVSALGVNCTVGPKPMLDVLERLVPASSKPVAVLPNAGRPQCVDGRTFYVSTPDYFCVYAKRFIEAGARILGGCCGTTPEHIRKMAESVSQKQPRAVSLSAPRPAARPECVPLDPVPAAKKSALSRALLRGRFVRLVEMTPPRGRDIEKPLEGARRLKAFGIDAINIPDGPRASARMTGIALALKLQSEVGMEAVLHFACRDHSLLGLQSALLGASVLGVKNVLSITGDPPMLGDYPQSSAVFDIDSIGLTRLIRDMNRGLDAGGKPIGSVTAFFVGVGADPNAVNGDRERDRYFQKVDAGAEFVITQPVFDVDALERFLERTAAKRIPVLAGIWPLMSLRNAEFMRNEVPGVTVPESVLERIGRYESKDDQRRIGIEIAQEMVRRVAPSVQGVQISAPFGRVDAAMEVAEAAP